MGSGPEDLDVLNESQQIADEIWARVITWDNLAREVVGVQMARAADSVGANIAEAFGRFHYADKVRFLYYARGSLFEAKFWLQRSQARGLISKAESADFEARFTSVAKRLNALARDLRSRSRSGHSGSRAVHEPGHDSSLRPSALADSLILDEDRGLPALDEG